jgi:hypothetical protein
MDCADAGDANVDPRHLATDHELMHGLGAFVGDDRFEVEGMTDRAVLGGDAGAAEDVATLARDVDRHAHIVPLRERHLGRLHLARVFQSTQLQGQQLGERDATRHVGQFELHRLRRGDRAIEQDAVLGVFVGFGQAGDRRADRAPGDAIARLRQAAQRPLQAFDVRQTIRIGDAHVVEEKRARHRGTQAHLLVDFLRRETRGIGRHDGGLRPDDRDLGHVPFVIHILAPLMTQSLPSFLALVFMLAGSEPPCGSVRPKQPMTSPRAMRGSHSRRCSSLP